MMFFVGLGILLLAMKVAAYGMVAAWSWPLVLAPFGAAIVWWSFADRSGITARKAVRQDEQRKRDRMERNRINLGAPVRGRRK